MSHGRPVIVLLATAGISLAAGRTHAAPEDLSVYIVQPGDSCWSIAQKLFGKGKAYRIIHQHNKLGPMPHILAPGMKLRIPGFRPDARVEWTQAKVQAKPPNLEEWLEAEKDMGLWRLYKVATGSQASARIAFLDGSKLRMREKALLVIYGQTVRRSHARSRVGTTVALEKGTVRGGLARLDQEAALQLDTPSAKVVLRSRSAQVEVDENKASVVSVFDGHADVTAKGSQVKVAEGQGTRVDRGKPPEPPRPLPVPPHWTQDGPVVVLVPLGARGQFGASWRPVPGAARYRVQLARDRQFRYLVMDAVTGAGVLQMQARDLAPATYYARVSVQDSGRLEGRPSTVLEAVVGVLEASRKMTVRPKQTYEVVGLLSLSPPRFLASGVQLSVNGRQVPRGKPVRLFVPGRHTITVSSLPHGRRTSFVVHLLRVEGKLGVPNRPLISSGPPVPISLDVRDERGRPASVPGLTLDLSDGTKVPLTTGKPGQHLARLPLHKLGPGPVTLVARWAGGELDRSQVVVEVPASQPVPAPPPEPDPDRFRWPWGPVALEPPVAVPGLPSRGARPTTAMEIVSTLGWAKGPANESDPVYLRLALRGELALLRNRLGLDVDLPVLHADIDKDEPGKSEAGDLRAGLRFLALDRGGFALTPSVRVSIPSGQYPRERNATYIEPGLLASWSRWNVFFGTNQIFIIDAAADEETALHYAGSYVGGYRLLELIDFCVEVQTLFGLLVPDTMDRKTAVAAAGAVRFQLERVRIGLMAGGGINDDARDLVGKFSAGLTADLGFKWP